jgi:hypothetical protein
VPLSGSERDLAAIASSAGHDQFLEALVRFADSTMSVGIPVRLIVGGYSVSGVLGADEAFASELERVLDVGLREAEEASPEHRTLFAALREHFAAGTFFSRQMRKRREREDELRAAMREALGAEPPASYLETVAALPDDIGRRFIGQRYHSAVTVRDAWVTGPAGDTVSVPFIRVSLSDVSAWWLQRSEPDSRG